MNKITIPILEADEKKEAEIDKYFASKEIKTRKISTSYYELITAVETKYPEETRHETALRYIKQAEHREDNEVRCEK